MTINMIARFKLPARELKILREFVGNNSPINKKGITPKPTENPVINTIKLASGKKLM
jgi:hypothetical protein